MKDLRSLLAVVRPRKYMSRILRRGMYGGSFRAVLFSGGLSGFLMVVYNYLSMSPAARLRYNFQFLIPWVFIGTMIGSLILWLMLSIFTLGTSYGLFKARFSKIPRTNLFVTSGYTFIPTILIPAVQIASLWITDELSQFYVTFFGKVLVVFYMIWLWSVVARVSYRFKKEKSTS